ncbi:hypothetical protein R3P38DRAFT_3452832 [Favolaschia claudopus]|uniref:Uncharacterized protein n=1 Tax=Favolaschia claudopus TaxID=2862362 RepID=A0AAW0CRZ1_9AGAR
MAPARKLAALFDTPSSPLVPPSTDNGHTESTTPAGSPSHFHGRHTSSLPSTPTNRRSGSSSPYSSARSNRRARHTQREDFTQGGVYVAKKLKLKPEGVMMLEEFAKNANSMNEIRSYGQLLRITEMQALVSAPAGSFVIPKNWKYHKIDVHTFRTLLSPTLPFYVKKAGTDSPSGIVKKLIFDHAGEWGVTSEDIDDKAKWSVMASRVRTRLTDRRYDIKKTISDSIWITIKTEEGEVTVNDREDPLDIIQLCEVLVNLVDANLHVTLPLLGRVAVLRQVLIDDNGGAKFWEKVDDQLSKLREKYENDETRISKAIGKVLKNDCRTFGNPDLSLFK